MVFFLMVILILLDMFIDRVFRFILVGSCGDR